MNYYIEIFKKVENIKFNITMASLKTDSEASLQENSGYNVTNC